MNNRDPFNLRQHSASALAILRSNSAVVKGTLVEGGEALGQGLSSAAQTVSAGMSSYAPYTLPVQQSATDQWQSAGRSRPVENANAGIAEKVGEFFGTDKKDSLPMYKDKPYAYPGGRMKGPWFRRRRVIASTLLVVLGLSWWVGLFTVSAPSTSSAQTSSSRSSSSWASWTRPDWASRAEKVKETFKISFSGYEKHAWGFDQYSPINKHHKQMTPKGMGWIIVDALDTMMLMGLSDELAHARQWLHSNLTYDQDHDVNTFETTIRMLGGLLSAHYLSTEFPGLFTPVDDGLSDDLYVEKAADLADRLLGAYESTSGVPYASINLHTAKGIPSHDDGGASSTAEAATLQLEMKYLSHLTGEDEFWKKAEHVMQVIDNNNARDGLVPIFLYADSGSFRGSNIRLGSRGDSYYEYLIKQYLQTSEEETVYQDMWKESLAGVKKHLITYSNPSNFTVLAERPSGLAHEISPKMDHLVCFMPGTIALASTKGRTLTKARKQPEWDMEDEENIRLAEELMKTCWGMYKVTPTGLAGEITHFNIYDPPHMFGDYPSNSKPASPAAFDDVDNQVGKEDFIIKPLDSHNLQRPETVESLFYMWRITGDKKYREWGWEMFESFLHWTATEDGEGFSSLGNVLVTPPPMRDNMESFWLAETLKYFYLLFSHDDMLPLRDVVFNTEAHPFPRFEMGPLFKTGWKRLSRDKSGNLLNAARTGETALRHDGAPSTHIATGHDHDSTKGRTVADTAGSEKSVGGGDTEATLVQQGSGNNM